MRSGFVEPSFAGWRTTLAEIRHDVYHLPEYVELSAGRLEGGNPFAFVAEEDGHQLLVPLVVRPVQAGAGRRPSLFDATSPYGYPGPLLRRGADGEDGRFLVRAVEAFLDGLRERHIISAFIRLHPILTLPLAPLHRIGRVVPHGDTVSVDLALPREDLWSQTRQNHRRDITKAARSGQTARIDDGWEAFDTFVNLYYQTMQRLNAEEYYYFPTAYLIDLKATLQDRLHLCVVEVEGQVAAAGLFTEVCGIVQYHLSGTADAFTASHPLKTMLNFVSDWAKRRGNQVLHLGGGLGGQRDSLYHFKAGFSHIRHPFFTWRVVSEEAGYRRAVERWEARTGRWADPIEGFFPPYRKPAADRRVFPNGRGLLAAEAGSLDPTLVEPRFGSDS
jgi:hypothetical protein